MLYRVFPFVDGAEITEEGGPLYVPRARQGPGRHDAPHRYGALYASRTIEAAIAERIQGFRGQVLTESDLHPRDGSREGLATLDDSSVDDVVDLDDPRELVHRDLRPSRVATRDRTTTQAIAITIFDEGRSGFAWWSVLEASWANVTLFAERVLDRLRVLGEPQVLSIDHPSVRAAADAVGVHLR